MRRLGEPVRRYGKFRMTIAVRCPACLTAFRVPPAALERTGAKLRCGVCQHVFEGATARFEVPATEAGLTSSLSSAASTPDADADDWEDDAPYVPSPDEAMQTIDLPRDLLELNDPLPTAVGSETMPDALLAKENAIPTPVNAALTADVAVSTDEAGSTTETPALVPADLGADPQPISPKSDLTSSAVGTAPQPAVASFLQARHPHILKIRRIVRMLSIVLGLGLVLQFLFLGRNHLVTWVPQVRPVLRALCLPVGCKLEWPRRIDDIAIESSTLDPLNAARAQALGLSGIEPLRTAMASAASAASSSQSRVLLLSVVLRNRGNLTLAWPALELSLTNEAEQTLARRVLQPVDYLPLLARADSRRPPLDGLLPAEERVLRIPLRAPAANGFRVDLFYP